MRIRTAVLLSVAITSAICVLFFANAPPRDAYVKYEATGYFDCSCTAISAVNDSCFFSTPASGRGDIYKASLRDRTFTPVVATSACEYAPVCSKNQQYLAFVRSGEGNQRIWLKNMEKGGESIVCDCPEGDFLSQVSDDGRYVIVEHQIPNLGLTRRVVSTLVSTNSGTEKVLTGYSAFFLSNSEVLCTRGSDPTFFVSTYDILQGSSTDLCVGRAIGRLDESRILVLDSGSNLCVVDRKGEILSSITKLGEFETAVCGDGWIAYTEKSRGIVLRQVDDEANSTLVPERYRELIGLHVSSFGLSGTLVEQDSSIWQESSMVTISAPFKRWKTQFSASQLVWHPQEP